MTIRPWYATVFKRSATRSIPLSSCSKIASKPQNGPLSMSTVCPDLRRGRRWEHNQAMVIPCPNRVDNFLFYHCWSCPKFNYSYYPMSISDFPKFTCHIYSDKKVSRESCSLFFPWLVLRFAFLFLKRGQNVSTPKRCKFLSATPSCLAFAWMRYQLRFIFPYSSLKRLLF